MVITLLTLFGALAVLSVGAEFLVRGATALALRLGLSPLFIGLTIVGFGTSAPELAASVTATVRGNTGVSVGNVVGSNILNIAVILGLTALVRPITMSIATIRHDLPWVAGVAVVPFLTIPLGLMVPRWMGAILMALMAVYLWQAYQRARVAPPGEIAAEKAELESAMHIGKRRIVDSGWFNTILVVAGLACLIVGARFFVLSAVTLARTWGMSELAIGLTVVAAGTSMPELVTSIVAALRKNPDVVVGNIIGSNLFNMLGILGIAALVGPQTMGRQVILFDGPVLVLVSLAIGPMMASGGRLSRREGGMLVLGYCAYVAVLLVYAPTWFPQA
jgi:cation:H+ antiporter